MRYLGVNFVQSSHLKCWLTVAKRDFYVAANSIFGKIGRSASEEVPAAYFKQMHTDFTLWSKGPTDAKISVKFVGFCHQ